MIYFHYFTAASLEGIFSWLVMRLYDAGLAGEAMSTLVEATDKRLVQKEVGQLLDLDLNSRGRRLTNLNLARLRTNEVAAVLTRDHRRGFGRFREDFFLRVELEH